LYGDHTFEPVPFTISSVKAAAAMLQPDLNVESIQGKNELTDGTKCFSELDAASGYLGRFSGDQVMDIVKQFRQHNK